MLSFAFRFLALAVALLLTACATTQTPEQMIGVQDESMARPTGNRTKLDGTVIQFGTMLRGYPEALLDPVSIEVPPILNTSGVTDGLPTDLAPVLRTVLSKIGRPLEVVYNPQAPADIRLMEIGQLQSPRMRRALLSVLGSITEGETRLRKGWGVDIDALIPIKSGNESITTRPGGSVTTVQRDQELDLGFGTDRELEVTTLAIDLQLFNNYTGTVVDRLAESYRVNVVRNDKSYAFGIFFEGSGLGFRSRAVNIQSKSRALRMASELALVHLLGRYFRLPWWRIVTDVTTDEELVRWYRLELERSNPPETASKLKLLLFAHGHGANLLVQELTQQEVEISSRLKQEFGIQNDYEFMTRLWQTVPFESAEPRMESLRFEWQKQLQQARENPLPPPPEPAVPPPAEDQPAEDQPAAESPSSAPTYPTVAKCCPFRFEPAYPPPPPDNR
ncbi:MAG: hypothetical protein GY719_06330 [bacterium]|nr:hypothetical protein [bacterium]